jgi:hypothetical protein
MMTEENHAAISMPMPLGNNGPSETGQRVSTVLALGAILLGMAAISRAEWKREVMLPKLRGGRDSTGQSIAFLKAGKRDVHLREVRVLAPWKLAKGIRSMDLPAGTEKTISIFVKPERGDTNPHTTIVETEWSIEVDEMGGWVLDLVLHKKPPT